MEETAKHSRKRNGKWKKRIRKGIILFVILLLLAGAVMLFIDKLKAEYTITYDSYTASMGTISNSLSFSGSLQLIDNATYTASSSGTVRSVYAAAGDQVKEGDILMRMANGQAITAEFDGRINQLYVGANDKVAAGDSLIQVADFDHMQVSIRVDEYDISHVAVGQSCRITATATEIEMDSEIAGINYISSSAGSVAYYTATAYVDVPQGLYPGMQVTVTIPQEEAENVVILKMDALSFDAANQAYVYMENSEGTLEPVYVTTGVSNGNYVEITGGLSANDIVYVETEEETESGIASLFSSMFGRQQFNNGGGRNNFDPSQMQNMRQQRNTEGGMPSFGGGRQ